ADRAMASDHRGRARDRVEKFGSHRGWPGVVELPTMSDPLSGGGGRGGEQQPRDELEFHDGFWRRSGFRKGTPTLPPAWGCVKKRRDLNFPLYEVGSAHYRWRRSGRSTEKSGGLGFVPL